MFQLLCSRLYIPAVIADGFVDMINPRPFLVRRFISSSKMQSDGMPLTPHASESARFASFASKESAGKDIDAAYESNDAWSRSQDTKMRTNGSPPSDNSVNFVERLGVNERHGGHHCGGERREGLERTR